MAAGIVERIWAALTKVCEAWNSASAWMTLARRSRSASACFRDGAHHVLGQLNGPDLDVADLDPPGFGLGVEDALDVGAQLQQVFLLATFSDLTRLVQHRPLSLLDCRSTPPIAAMATDVFGVIQATPPCLCIDLNQ
jgi:hypothetical protein